MLYRVSLADEAVVESVLRTCNVVKKQNIIPCIDMFVNYSSILLRKISVKGTGTS